MKRRGRCTKFNDRWNYKDKNEQRILRRVKKEQKEDRRGESAWSQKNSWFEKRTRGARSLSWRAVSRWSRCVGLLLSWWAGESVGRLPSINIWLNSALKEPQTKGAASDPQVNSFLSKFIPCSYSSDAALDDDICNSQCKQLGDQITW